MDIWSASLMGTWKHRTQCWWTFTRGFSPSGRMMSPCPAHLLGPAAVKAILLVQRQCNNEHQRTANSILCAAKFNVYLHRYWITTTLFTLRMRIVDIRAHPSYERSVDRSSRADCKMSFGVRKAPTGGNFVHNDEIWWADAIILIIIIIVQAWLNNELAWKKLINVAAQLPIISTSNSVLVCEYNVLCRKDHVRRELQTSHKWPDKWGFLLQVC